MPNTPARLSLPVLVGDAQIGTVEVDLAVESRHSGQSVTINTTGNVDQAIAQSMVEIAERLAPGITAPQRWVTGVDQPLEWPTTPGSAVLADRHNGVGPQVLLLQNAAGGRGWWGASGDIAAMPSTAGGWTWSNPEGHRQTTFDLLQVLYVASDTGF